MKDNIGKSTIKYKDILNAKELLNLPERASMKEIKTNYKTLIAKWHPDKCEKNKDECKEMTIKIVAAYKIITAYCKQYKYSFAKEEVKQYLSEEDWWFERFGDDPIWGNSNKP